MPNPTEHHASPHQSYRTCTYTPRALPTVLVTVVGAEVTREAFDGFAETDTGWTEVDGLGDAASFNSSTGSLRVLKGSTFFIVSVTGSGDRLAMATALARKASSACPRGRPSTP